MTDTTTTSRPYRSPLRERQASATRGLILDALVVLLEEQRADEITNRELADASGVSERTVYRHFPDRDALLAGLVDRLETLTNSEDRIRDVESLADFQTMAERFMNDSDEHFVAARAEALFNADPRKFSQATRARSKLAVDVVVASAPHLDVGDHLHIAAVIRCLVSAQAWLRMREEFGVPGSESGPLVAWAIGAMFNEIERGNPPPHTP